MLWETFASIFGVSGFDSSAAVSLDFKGRVDEFNTVDVAVSNCAGVDEISVEGLVEAKINADTACNEGSDADDSESFANREMDSDAGVGAPVNLETDAWAEGSDANDADDGNIISRISTSGKDSGASSVISCGDTVEAVDEAEDERVIVDIKRIANLKD